MTDTPIDRESVERLAAWLQDDDLHEEGQRHVAETLLALRAALDEAEAALEQVRAEERERCAEAADTYATAWDADPSDDYFEGWIRAAERIAATIRARGETKKPPAIKPRAS